MPFYVRRSGIGFLALLLVVASMEAALAQTSGTIKQAVVGDAGDSTREVSTEQLETILAKASATVLDARPHLEYAISHIPGAVNVAAKPGVPISMYVSDVAEIGRLVGGNKGCPGEVKRAKDDGRLPMEDHNTRILVVGNDAASARYVAEALSREAFHNVSYFRGPFDALRDAVSP